MEKAFLISQLNGNMRRYGNIQKIATGQGDNYTTGCLLDLNYFCKHYKMKSIDLSKQQELDANLKAIQLINLNENLD